MIRNPFLIRLDQLPAEGIPLKRVLMPVLEKARGDERLPVLPMPTEEDAVRALTHYQKLVRPKPNPRINRTLLALVQHFNYEGRRLPRHLVVAIAYALGPAVLRAMRAREAAVRAAAFEAQARIARVNLPSEARALRGLGQFKAARKSAEDRYRHIQRYGRVTLHRLKLRPRPWHWDGQSGRETEDIASRAVAGLQDPKTVSAARMIVFELVWLGARWGTVPEAVIRALAVALGVAKLRRL